MTYLVFDVQVFGSGGSCRWVVWKLLDVSLHLTELMAAGSKTDLQLVMELTMVVEALG